MDPKADGDQNITPGHVSAPGCAPLSPPRAQVRHDLTDVGDGETVIVTLADKPLLDERGNLRDEDDELENTLLVRWREGIAAGRKPAGGTGMFGARCRGRQLGTPIAGLGQPGEGRGATGCWGVRGLCRAGGEPSGRGVQPQCVEDRLVGYAAAAVSGCFLVFTDEQSSS
jgi:hypothetical protein